MANTTLVPLFVDSSTALPAYRNTHINMEEVESWAPIDFPSLQNRPAKWAICFAMFPGETRATANFLYYVDAATRNTSLANLKTLVSQNI